MQPKISLVVTTIGSGDFLDVYADQIIAEGLTDQVAVIVIPDLKTPPVLFEKCAAVRARGIAVECPDMSKQAKFLEKLGEIKDIIPVNSDNRRNIGYLMALANGSEMIISIDDDNFCRPGENFFKEHGVVRQGKITLSSVDSSSGWFNICDLMEMKQHHVYPRGFPYAVRHTTPELTYAEEQGEVHINAGLWLLEPDLDAITWLVSPTRTTALTKPSILLGKETWSPINTQNTALHRAAVAAYYFIPMGYPLGGVRIDRFGDIFSGYFAQKCARHLGYRIRVGTPLVDHRRNSHNYLKDAMNEMGCIWFVEEFAEWLRSVKLTGATYLETYLSLAEAMDRELPKLGGIFNQVEAQAYLAAVTRNMRIWSRTVKSIGL